MSFAKSQTTLMLTLVCLASVLSSVEAGRVKHRNHVKHIAPGASNAGWPSIIPSPTAEVNTQDQAVPSTELGPSKESDGDCCMWFQHYLSWVSQEGGSDLRKNHGINEMLDFLQGMKTQRGSNHFSLDSEFRLNDTDIVRGARLMQDKQVDTQAAYLVDLWEASYLSNEEKASELIGSLPILIKLANHRSQVSLPKNAAKGDACGKCSNDFERVDEHALVEILLHIAGEYDVRKASFMARLEAVQNATLLLDTAKSKDAGRWLKDGNKALADVCHDEIRNFGATKFFKGVGSVSMWPLKLIGNLFQQKDDRDVCGWVHDEDYEGCRTCLSVSRSLVALQMFSDQFMGKLKQGFYADGEHIGGKKALGHLLQKRYKTIIGTLTFGMIPRFKAV